MRSHGVLSATVDAHVAFHDVDMVSVVWHGHYLKYLENARWALMDRIGFGLDAMRGSGFVWPIVEVHVKYINAARFGDRLEVRASLVEWRNRLVINYLIRRADSEERVARGRTIQVAVEAASGTLQFTSPPLLLDRVQRALESAGSGS